MGVDELSDPKYKHFFNKLQSEFDLLLKCDQITTGYSKDISGNI